MRWLALYLLLAAPAWAVQPDEMLDDPVLEERAQDLSAGLRCLVCRNESIEESDAGIARDLRLLVRERLVAGDSDGEVIDFIVERYGEYVLLRPTLDGVNIVLWAAPVGLLLLIGGGFWLSRRRATTDMPDDLTEAERDRLAELMRD
ncbi:MAG: cytochrome c-type biogenesis protein [Shimia sp.]